jgi:hypothetical protein
MWSDDEFRTQWVRKDRADVGWRDTDGRYERCVGQMRTLFRASVVLFLLTSLACTPEEPVRFSPTSTVATTPTLSPSPTRTPLPSPSRTSPAASATATATTQPGQTPNAACPARTGGSPLTTARLVAIRAAHNPGFDRAVFEWSGEAVPEYRVEIASAFRAPSDQPVRVDGNAFFSVRMSGQAHTDAPPPGARSYPQPDPYHVALPAVREIKLVEDFEGVVIFGLGMERVICPTVITLLGPPRVVVDFPTPP